MLDNCTVRCDYEHGYRLLDQVIEENIATLGIQDGCPGATDARSEMSALGYGKNSPG
jgi:hypothetical protein